MRFLGLIREGTDISQFKKTDFEIVPCKCGCGRTAKLLKTSKQKFFSSECRKRGGVVSKDVRSQWRTENDFMIRG